MKIIEFSLFSVLVFKGLRNNKPDKVFGKPLSFFFGRKSWQKEPHARCASVFQGPLRPKKQAWFFFLELIAGQEKRTKKETLEKNRLIKTGKKNLAEENALVTHLLDKGIDRRCGNVKGLWLL